MHAFYQVIDQGVCITTVRDDMFIDGLRVPIVTRQAVEHCCYGSESGLNGRVADSGQRLCCRGERHAGHTKASMREVLRYLRQLGGLRMGQVSARFGKFSIVGATDSADASSRDAMPVPVVQPARGFS